MVFSAKAIGLGFNTLLNGLVNFKDVDARSSACTSYKVQTRVEYYLSDGGLSTATLELLEGLTSISTKYFDNATFLIRTGDESAIRID